MLRSTRNTRSHVHAPAEHATAPEADKENATAVATTAAAAAKPASALSLLGKRTATGNTKLLAGVGGKASLLKPANRNASVSASDVASVDPVKPVAATAAGSLAAFATPFKTGQESSSDSAHTPAPTSSSLLRKPATLLSSPLASSAPSSTPLKLRPAGSATVLIRPQPSPTAAAMREPAESTRTQAAAMEADAVVQVLPTASPTLSAAAPATACAAAATNVAIPALPSGLSCFEPTAAPVTAAVAPISSPVAPLPTVQPTPAAQSTLHVTSAPSSLAASSDPQCFVVAGRSYRKLALLGKGGCGEVWRVQDPEGGPTRALKRMTIPAPLPADADGKVPASQRIVSDFANEIRILQRFSGTVLDAERSSTGDDGSRGHVVRLIAHEIELQPDGSKLVSLLLEEGGPCLHSVLTALAKSSGNLTADLDGASSCSASSSAGSSSSGSVRRELFRSLAQCVAKVHRRNVAHLDLKPANFVQMAASSPDSAQRSSSSSSSIIPTQFALIDFGIARIVDGQENADAPTDAPSAPQGSFNYMSPESLSLSRPVGRPADIWALGVLLFSLVYSTRSIVTPFAHFKSYSEKEEARKISVIVNSRSEPAPAAAAVPAPSTYSESHPYHIAFGATKHMEAVSLIRWCMRNKPEERPTIEQVLAHPFLTGGDAADAAVAATAAPAQAQPAPPAAISCSVAAPIAVAASSVASPSSSASCSYLVTGAQLHSLLSSLADRSLSAAQLLEIERSFVQQLQPAL